MTLEPDELAKVRWRHLSYIMQGSMSVLNPVRRIRESFVDFAWSHLALPRAGFDRLVETHLARVQLDPGILDAYPHELSGGMRQRVTIALATICRPDFIIADEPTTALDVIVQKDVLDMIRDIQREMGSSVLFVTHDMRCTPISPTASASCMRAAWWRKDRRSNSSAIRVIPTPRI